MVNKKISKENLEKVIHFFDSELPIGWNIEDEIEFNQDEEHKSKFTKLSCGKISLRLPDRVSYLDGNILGNKTYKPHMYLWSETLHNIKSNQYQRTEVQQSIILYGGKIKDLKESFEDREKKNPYFDPNNYWQLNFKHHKSAILYLSYCCPTPNNSFMRNVAQILFNYKAGFVNKLAQFHCPELKNDLPITVTTFFDHSPANFITNKDCSYEEMIHQSK